MSVFVEISNGSEIEVDYEFDEGNFEYEIKYVDGMKIAPSESDDFIAIFLKSVDFVKIERACKKDLEEEIRLRQEDIAASRYYDKYGY